jgi:hypothetical protein
MEEKIIKILVEFLRRVQLQGSEVPAFNECLKALELELPKKEE